ncbi:acyltransferase [Patulibacter defluvii]|uniref:acyltransferase n=1 Tax=Patulibacter defluvii TaxID=3095358 RepID=UPI002A74E3C4|nr:acyltransferase [Patulibacter sp. DM4]
MSLLRRIHLRIARDLDLKLPHLASRLRRRWLYLRHPNVDLQIDPTAHIGPRFQLVAPFGGKLVVGPYAEFRRGTMIELGPEAEIVIGRRAIFTNSALVQITTRLEIGEGVGLAQDTTIYDGRHGWDEPGKRWYELPFVFRPIVIGEGAGINNKCTITASIGVGTIVAANSVVNRDLPDNVMAGGIPAKVLRNLGEPGATSDAGGSGTPPAADA